MKRIFLAATVAAFACLPPSAEAQFFGGGGFGAHGCAPCGTSAPIAMAAPPVTASYSPCAVQSVCACAQPVAQTVYREVPVTKYRTVQKTVKKPVYKTVYEDRDVTRYRQEFEQKTAEVPYTTYQTVSQCQTVSVDNSRWQTNYQRVNKVSPCEYDRRPGFLGWMNRTGYSFRSAFTPNVVANRQYVSDVRTAAVPVTRQIPVTATRQVSYNVAKLVPYQAKERVAKQVLEYEDATVTAYEPYTEMQTVAVGTQTQMAYFGGFGGTATALLPSSSTTANQPVRSRTATKDSPTRAAQNPRQPNRSAGSNFKLNSYEPEEDPAMNDLHANAGTSSEWAPSITGSAVIQVAGWRPASSKAPLKIEGPSLNVAAK